MYYRQPFEGAYPITQPYGATDTSSFHTGIDYGCPTDTPILASEAGSVVFSGWDNTGYGYCVVIAHPDGNGTLYAHFKAVAVRVGDSVRRSQVVGYSGSTGNSTGPHLHFEARREPRNYLTHFDPMKLPLHSSIEPVAGTVPEQPKDAPNLKEADQLGPNVEIVAPSGAWGWSQDFSKRQTVYPCGTKLHFTGRTTKRNEYTYCEVYPEPVKYWVAVHDNDCQILDNSG